MKIQTVEAASSRFKLRTNSAGSRVYCSYDQLVRRTPIVESIEAFYLFFLPNGALTAREMLISPLCRLNHGRRVVRPEAD